MHPTKLAPVLLLVLVATGCPYQPPFELTCDEEGARESGRVCRDGIWVSDDAGTVVPDGSIPDSGGPDAADGSMPDAACVPEADADMCVRLSKNCGDVTDLDNCGASRTVACGDCTDPETCGGGGTANVCGCPGESDQEFCDRLVKNCDDVTAEDLCGVQRTVNCGTCTAPSECGGGGTPNSCACPGQTDVEFCAENNAECGRLEALDDCNAVRVVDCGSDVCTLPETCGGGGTANQCGCTPQSAMSFCAAQNAECDPVSGTDNCGLARMEDCGACAGAMDVCVNNACFPDGDGDGVPDAMDNCPTTSNANQADGDTDGIGDACDNCPAAANANQANFDNDSQGDACDPDDDNDGAPDAQDSNDFNPAVCRDSDGDTCDDCSSGMFAPGNDGADFDADGLCDAGDPDDDNDGVNDPQDSNDANPNVCRDSDSDTCDDCSSGSSNPAADGTDTDGDGLCNAGDPDDDNDGITDTLETMRGSNPLDPNVCGDSDGDTCDDCAVGTDGLGPMSDAQPGNDGVDTDSDGDCNAGDDDDDNDGVLDVDDPASTNPDVCGDTDSDTCDDCAVGTDGFGALSDVDPANDGPDADADGICNAGDTEGTQTDCRDGLDNDGDGSPDCTDQDCDNVRCAMSPPRDCNFATGLCE